MQAIEVPFPETAPVSMTDFAELDPREVEILAAKMADAYKGMVEHYKHTLKLSSADAIAKADEPASGQWITQIMEADPDQVSWYQLEELAERDVALVKECWGSIKRVALYELQCGHRSADAVGGSPMDRARFLAIRHELAREWQLRNGIEYTLIDQMAQAHTQFLRWMNAFTNWSSVTFREPTQAEAEWEAPRLSDAEAVERAAALVDRWNRLFIRSLRALRDLRRYPVVVQNAGQVNVGEKQVNVGTVNGSPLPESSPGS